MALFLVGGEVGRGVWPLLATTVVALGAAPTLGLGAAIAYQHSIAVTPASGAVRMQILETQN